MARRNKKNEFNVNIYIAFFISMTLFVLFKPEELSFISFSIYTIVSTFIFYNAINLIKIFIRVR